MKKIILFICLGFLLNVGSGQWTVVPSGVTVDINSCQFVINDAWAVGNSGKLLHSTNGGQTWSSTTIPLFNLTDLSQIKFVTFNKAFIVAYNNGVIAQTIDAGVNWTYIQKDQFSQVHNSIDFAPDNTNIGFVSSTGNIGGFYKTTDMGATWSPLVDLGIGMRQIKLVSQNLIFAVGSSGSDATILRSTNGGTVWSQKTFLGFQYFFGLYFINSSVGWACGSDGQIYKTIDGGNTWTSQTTGTVAFLISIYFKDAMNGWAVGNGGTIIHTSDGGATWEIQASGTTKDLLSISFGTSGTNGVIVGRSGTILNTTTGGLLPINLLTFSGKAENKTIELQWQTASELNNKGFELQRFEKNEWRPLTFIAGKDNSSVTTNYTYTDLRPLQGNNSYRLKQMDKDGKSNYSQVLSVKMENSNVELQLSPVPANGFVTVSYALAMKEKVQVNLININGQPVTTIVNEIQNAGSYTVNVPLTGFAKGSYYVQLLTGKKQITKLLIVQ